MLSATQRTMWQSSFLMLLTFSTLSKCQDIGDMDFDDLDFGDWEDPGMGMDQDFQNELLDNLIQSYIVNYPKKVDFQPSDSPISGRPLLMTARSVLFEDMHSIKRSSPVSIHEESEMLAHIKVHFGFDTFVVTYEDFASTLGNFTARAKLIVQVTENELFIQITGGKVDEKCFVEARDISFTKLKTFKVEYYSNSKKEKSAKCDKNIGVFRAFFGRMFINIIKPTFAQRLSEAMNGFVKSMEESVCSDV